MKAFASDGKFGAPAKKRSRRISTSNRGVTERMCLITTNTYLRTLCIAVAPNSGKLIVTNWRHWPKVPVRGTWNEYSFTSTLLPNGGKGARLRTPTPLVSSIEEKGTVARERHPAHPPSRWFEPPKSHF